MYYQVIPMPLDRTDTTHMVVDVHFKLSEPYANQALAQVRADELNAEYDRVLAVL